MAAAARLPDHPTVPPLSTQEFCIALVAALVAQGQRRLPMGHPGVDQGLRELVKLLCREVDAALDRGDETSAHAFLDVLADISPNSNTGIFDAFWSRLRTLQPGHLGIPNPLYEYADIRVSPGQAEAELKALAPEWRNLVTEAASHLRQHI